MNRDGSITIETATMPRHSTTLLRLAVCLLLLELFFSIYCAAWWTGDFIICCVIVAVAAAYRTIDRWRHPTPTVPDQAPKCGNCGYDLRATPDPLGPRLPQCPECGHRT